MLAYFETTVTFDVHILDEKYSDQMFASTAISVNLHEILFAICCYQLQHSKNNSFCFVFNFAVSFMI